MEEDCTGTNCDWSHSTLYSDLNSTYYLTNSYYVDNTNNWDDKILNVNWKYGDNTGSARNPYNADTAYSYENAFTNPPVNTQIGLMYIYDYYYANGLNGNQELVNGNKYNTNGWIHRSHTDNNVLHSYEWLITRYGLHSNGLLFCTECAFGWSHRL